MRLLTLKVLVSLPLFLSLRVMAATPVQQVAENPTAFKMRAGLSDRIQVKGFKGTVDYVAIENSTELSVNVVAPTQDKTGGVDWEFSFFRDGETLVVQIEGPHSKRDWAEILQNGKIPEYGLKILGPSLPLSVNWNEGAINVSGLKSDLLITAIAANITVKGGEGESRLTTQEGSIFVNGRKGKLNVDSYQAKVEVTDIEGDFELENFIGESKVNKIAGNMRLSSHKGVTKVAAVKGRLDFKNGNAALHVEDLEGELRGKSDQGAVYAEVNGNPDIHVESKNGAVNLRLPASTGAWVNLGTQEGQMTTPSALKQTRVQSQLIKSGRLRGGSGGGSVWVRTQSGDIKIR